MKTNVISISYGGQEVDLPIAYQRRQCNEFMKLGMQGVSVVLASGDSGVAGPSGCLGTGKIFSPDFVSNTSLCLASDSATLGLSKGVSTSGLFLLALMIVLILW